jgi:hypothetical protein
LEKVLKRDVSCPVVTAGRGACPPEDCGGLWGYQDLLALSKYSAISNKEQSRLEWFGMDEGWEPGAFDKQAVNALIEQTYEGGE